MEKKKTKYFVDYVPSKELKDYAGMNYYAAKDFGFKDIHHKNEIMIDKTQSREKQERNIKHEMVESTLMRYKHYPYWKAHLKALEAEKMSMESVREYIERIKNS